MEKKNSPVILAASLVIAGLVFIASCVKTDTPSCVNATESPVLKIEGSDTALVNQADTLKVTYLVLNSCGKSAVASPSVATQSSIVHIMVTYDGCVCTQVAFQKTLNYIFKSPNPGTYTLNFWGGNDTTVLTKTILVK